MNNQFSDDFINYSFFPNDVFDPDFNLSSPFSEQSDSTNLPNIMPKTIKNILDPEEEPLRKESSLSESSLFVNNVNKSNQHGKKSKADCSELEEMSEMLEDMDDTEFTSPEPEPEPKIISRSKKIQKKEKPVEKPKPAKGRQTKQTRVSATEALLKKVDPRFIPEGFDDPDLDDKTRKKMIQMIRNRVSAQTSRDRKKAYMMQVEQDKEELSEENEKLTRENANLLAKVKKLQEENDMLKQNMLCGKCGCTYAGNSPNQETTEGSSPNRSDSSGPTRTVRGRKGVFGFSMAFAAILCFFLFLNGGSIGDFSSHGSKMKKMKPTMQFVSRLLNTPFDNAPTCSKEFGNKYMQNQVDPTDPSLLEELAGGILKEFEQDQTEVINKIKPIMEQFEAHHKELYQVFESKNDIIDLSNVKQELDVTSRNDNKNSSFEGKNSVAKQNKTSTLFCPSGFELSTQAKSGDKMEEEFDPMKMEDTNQLSKKTLDVQNAEYIQLLIPKHSMEQAGTVDVEKNRLAFKKFDEESSFIEVWCKIFAIRDLANLASY